MSKDSHKYKGVTPMTIANSLCLDAFGTEPTAIESINASGSSRQYFRLILKDRTVVMCLSDNLKENITFLNLTRYLLSNAIPVPKILAVSLSKEAYLLEDLGNTDFLHILRSETDSEKVWLLIDIIIKNLVEFQSLPESEWENIVEFDPLGLSLIDYDLNYARYNLFDAVGVVYDEKRLEVDYDLLRRRLMDCPRHLWGLMFRDFQSRNIMIGDTPYFIDYQSSRLGPGIYDLVSFAWQAKAGFSSSDRDRIIKIYIRHLQDKRGEVAMDVDKNVAYWALFRILQTLGAYGLRGLREGKTHFIESIPMAVVNFNDILSDSLHGEFPELEKIGKSLIFCNFAEK